VKRKGRQEEYGMSRKEKFVMVHEVGCPVLLY
jgi:hypothetical protein